MIRRTTKKVYKEIIESGLLSKRRTEVYEGLFNNGPSTASELFQEMSKFNRNPTHSNITTRLGELRDMGVVEENGTVVCKVTGRNVIQWVTNNNLPKALPKKISKEDKKKAILKETRAFLKNIPTNYKPELKNIINMIKEI